MGPFFMVLRRVDGFAVHAFNERSHNDASGMPAVVERVDGRPVHPTAAWMLTSRVGTGRPPYRCWRTGSVILFETLT